jgi:NitT/TauT family transport system ATP-binding protein
MRYCLHTEFGFYSQALAIEGTVAATMGAAEARQRNIDRGNGDQQLKDSSARPGQVVLRNVSKRYDDDAESPPVLEDINLDVQAGELLALLGPTGCGKSTLLRIVAGLTPHSGGTVTFGGRPITGPGPDRGMLFQDYALFPWKTVRGNVEFGLRYGPRARRPSAKERNETVARYIELVGLSGSENKYVHQLSGGMKQRTALARLWATDPDVLLMDEPLAALDAQTRIVLQNELLRIWGQERPTEERKTVIYVTHSIDEAIFLADRIAVMGSKPGRIREVLDVDIPRPRTDALRAGPQFQRLYEQIWELIRSEAYRATVES